MLIFFSAISLGQSSRTQPSIVILALSPFLAKFERVSKIKKVMKYCCAKFSHLLGQLIYKIRQNENSFFSLFPQTMFFV
jgi:hypothetical protein